MTQGKKQLEIAARGRDGKNSRASGRGAAGLRGRAAKTTVSGRWLLVALGLTLGLAVLCAWSALCLLFWQGSWQLLYHPAAAKTRTPASAGLAFDAVEFAAGDTGMPQLQGWWIPAAPEARLSRFTVLYLHGQNGNLSGAVDALARLHAAGVNVLAFDYRGYGRSRFARPSETHWREDAQWALEYLTGTRHVAPEAIVLDGTDLGANLALEIAAAHPGLAGVIVESPLADPMAAVFSDARARIVPARMLVRDRYDLNAAAARCRLPVLWFEEGAQSRSGGSPPEPEAYGKIPARKTIAWVSASGSDNAQIENAMAQWLNTLQAK